MCNACSDPAFLHQAAPSVKHIEMAPSVLFAELSGFLSLRFLNDRDSGASDER